ncbi:MAG: hypothetical protein DBY36_08435, partial [Clostridiales bacterium]
MKFNLFSMIHNKKERKKGPNIVLSDTDMALFLVAFTAIFGILHYRVLREPLNVTVFGLILTFLFCAFWVGMAFTGGRYLRKGFWITALVIWGMALLCCIANLKAFSFLFQSTSTVVNTLAGYLAFTMLLFVAATIAPLLPGLAMLGYLPQTEMELLIICAVFMAILALSFVFGYYFQRGRKRAAEAARLRHTGGQ